MLQQTSQKLAHPRRFEVFFHLIKTGKLIGLLLIDRRVPVIRKLLFVLSVALFLIILFFPDVIGEAILIAVLPPVGTVLGVPLDAGFDWVAFALIVVSLLRFFPPEMVSEHYRNIFNV